MKTLYESLLDGFDDIDNPSDLRQVIENWIKKNYSFKNLDISKSPNKDGKFEVSSDTVIVGDGNDDIPSLTNGLFIWKKVKSFNCSYCDNLTSLEGGPEEVSRHFNCSRCHSLTSLKGAPKKVGKDFDCSGCTALTSLEGSPEIVGNDFNCGFCDKLTSLEGVPQKIGGSIYCFQRNDLKSYELPKGTKIKGVIHK